MTREETINETEMDLALAANVEDVPEVQEKVDPNYDNSKTMTPFQLVNGRKWKNLNSKNDLRYFEPELQLTMIVKLIEDNPELPAASKLASFFIDPKSNTMYTFWAERRFLKKYWPKSLVVKN